MILQLISQKALVLLSRSSASHRAFPISYPEPLLFCSELRRVTFILIPSLHIITRRLSAISFSRTLARARVRSDTIEIPLNLFVLTLSTPRGVVSFVLGFTLAYLDSTISGSCGMH